VKSAEAYYRNMHARGVSTWNLRDTHMMDTLDAIHRHLGDARIVVWAHNSHVGDATATERGWGMPDELTLGQLCRERHPDDTLLVGFTTDHGSVTAATNWDEDPERKTVRPAMDGSYEELFHAVGIPRFVLDLGSLGEAAGELHDPRLHRAIGVIYRPRTERQSHYYHVRLPLMFDLVVHVDETSALVPLDRASTWDPGELPETFPSGL